MSLVIGIDIAGSEIRWIGIRDDGAGSLSLHPMAQRKLPLPVASEQQGANLQTLLELVQTHLGTACPSLVAIIRADHMSKPARAKVEAVVQLATNATSIPTKLVASQSATHALKKGDDGTLAPLVAALPAKYLKKALAAAWKARREQ